MSRHAELVADVGCVLGEAPTWDASRRTLFLIDAERGRVHAWSGDGCATVHHDDAGRLGGLCLDDAGALLTFGVGGAVHRLTLATGASTVVLGGIPREHDTRFNDVIADARGRVYAGVLPTEERTALVYRLELPAAVAPVLDVIGMPNGMAFDADDRALYCTDTIKRRILRCSFDAERGTLTGAAVVVQRRGRGGRPDGLAMDREGTLWSASWGDGAVFRYGVDGREIGRVDVPVPFVTSVAFGGDDLRDLYITTAGAGAAGAAAHAGALFAVRTDVAGLPRWPARVAADA